ncbi:transposase [Campylobacter fetus]|uniref:transposase n=1 Tax=Campylobacter fetus TaxID=196 RepID=UPI0026DF4DC9|nr:transposase [Campylobacter fetus]
MQKRRIVTYTKEFKEECVNLLKSGVSALALTRQTGVSRPTLAKWLKTYEKENFSIDNAINFTKKKIEELSKNDQTPQGVVMLSELVSALAKLENGVKKVKSIKDKSRPIINMDSPTANELKKRIFRTWEFIRLPKGNFYKAMILLG